MCVSSCSYDLYVSQVLMDMFDQGRWTMIGDDGPDTPTPRSSMSYEEIVKEMIHDEKQYQRDLHMLIHVFREELVEIVEDPKVSFTCGGPSPK